MQLLQDAGSLRPQLTNLKRRLKKSKLDEIIKKYQDDAYYWDGGKKLIPKSGTAYFISGPMSAAKAIRKADGLCWRNTTNGQPKAKPRHHFYCIAIPSDNLFGKAGQKRNLLLKAITFRKIVTYDKKSSIFIVEYAGDDTQYPWKRKPLKAKRKRSKSGMY